MAPTESNLRQREEHFKDFNRITRLFSVNRRVIKPKLWRLKPSNDYSPYLTSIVRDPVHVNGLLPLFALKHGFDLIDRLVHCVVDIWKGRIRWKETEEQGRVEEQREDESIGLFTWISVWNLIVRLYGLVHLKSLIDCQTHSTQLLQLFSYYHIHTQTQTKHNTYPQFLTRLGCPVRPSCAEHTRHGWNRKSHWEKQE